MLLEFEVPGDDDATVPGWLSALHQTARLCRLHAAAMPKALAPGRVISTARV